MTMLIVDDDADTRRLLGILLQRAGYADLRLLESAEEAFTALDLDGRPDAEVCDLILMDVTMSPVDGIEACRRIKAADHLRDVPIIMVTGRTQASDLQDAFEAGATDYVTKPINQVELLARVRSALRLKQEMDRRKARERDLLDLKEQLEAANRQLDLISRQDGLTGIANRRQFDHVLDQEWWRSTRSGDDLSLIMIDIDYFKRFNDTFGHQCGDECLRQVAACLSGGLNRVADFVARYGGEEFAVILPATDGEGARQVAERLRARVVDLGIGHPASDVNPSVTISLGVATARPARGGSAAGLLASADRALYAAKAAGRNRVESTPA